jgi:hypothetical protein
MTDILLCFIAGLILVLCVKTEKPMEANSKSELFTLILFNYLFPAIIAAILGAIVYGIIFLFS